MNRDDPDHYAGLLDIEQVTQFAFGPNTRKHQLNLMDGGTPIEESEYVYPSGLLDAVAVARHIDAGAAIVLPRANEHFESLARLVRGLEAELGCRAQTNAYLSPAGASAFLPHHDAHDVIAVQTYGSKTWTIYDNQDGVRPTRTFDARRDQPGPKRESFTTRQGDCCYLPQGVVHDAVSDDLSLHVTVGIHWVRVSEVLTTLIKQAIDKRPELHSVLPVNWWQVGADRDGAVAQVGAAAEFLQDGDAILDCFSFLRQDLVDTRQPLVPGQLEQLARIDELSANTVLAVRDPVLLDLLDDEEGPVLSCYGALIRFPPEAAGAVGELLDAGSGGTTAGKAAAAAGVSSDEVLVIARRLIREGVLIARW